MNAIEVVKPSYPLGDNENPLTIRLQDWQSA